MAGKKKVQVLTNVFTDDEWQAEVLLKETLTVVDVYSEIFGSCAAMAGPLRRYKLETAGDSLNLATANADTITGLERFREHSEPTWMFVAGGQLVNLYIGCECPVLMKLVEAELKKEQRVASGQTTRKALPFDKITPAEKERMDRLEALERDAKQEEEEKVTALLNKIRTKAYRQIADTIPDVTVVLFLPHSLEGGALPEVSNRLKNTLREMGLNVVRQDTTFINEEMANEMFWERRLPQHQALVDSLQAGPSIALMVKKEAAPASTEEEENADPGGEGDAPNADDAEEAQVEERPMEQGEIERMVAETIYGFFPRSGSVATQEGSGKSVRASPQDTAPEPQPESEQASRQGEGSEENEGVEAAEEEEEKDVGREATQDISEIKEGSTGSVARGSFVSSREGSQGAKRPAETVTWTPAEMRPALDSPAQLLLRRYSEQNVHLPGIWTPLTPFSKAAAVRVLFRNFALQYYEEETLPPPPPPTLLVVFDAAKRHEVMEAASSYVKEVIHTGFFNVNKKRLTNSIEEYDSFRFKHPKDKFVLAVSKTTSDPLLAVTAAGPSYVSPNLVIGKRDVEEYFSADVETLDISGNAPRHEIVVEEEEAEGATPALIEQDAGETQPAQETGAPTSETEEEPGVGEVPAADELASQLGGDGAGDADNVFTEEPESQDTEAT